MPLRLCYLCATYTAWSSFDESHLGATHVSKREELFARYLILFLTAFFAGGLLLLFGQIPLLPSGPYVMVGSALMALSAVAVLGGIILAGGFGTRRSPTSRGLPVRTPARVEYKFRTDDGKTLSGDEDAEGVERFHVVLGTKANRKLEVETARQVYDLCPEGMWGWAWLQGDWMGRFDPDPEMQRQMEL